MDQETDIGIDPEVQWQRCPGTMYLARVDDQSEWMLARFDYIELDRCPTQKQGKFPDKRSLYPFFLFGQKPNKRRIWTRLQNTLGPVCEKDYVESENDDGQIISPFGRFKKWITVPVKGAMKSSLDDFMEHGPYHQFQILPPPKMSREDDLAIHLKYLGCEQLDLLKLAPGSDWPKESANSQIHDLNRLKSEWVVDDPNAVNDPIQRNYKNALYKIKDLAVGDFVVAKYRKFKNFGIIKTVEPTKVEVHFYTMNKKEQSFREKNREIDWISESRQGYLVMTIPKRRLEKLVPKKTTKNSRVSFKFKRPYKFEQFEIDLEKAIEDWNKHYDSEEYLTQIFDPSIKEGGLRALLYSDEEPARKKMKSTDTQ